MACSEANGVVSPFSTIATTIQKSCKAAKASAACALLGLLTAAAAPAQTITEINVVAPFGSVNVGSSATETLTFSFSVGGTVQAPAILTQGVAGKDFTDNGTGTCTAGVYSAGASCSVVVKFAPKAAGLRVGAVELLNSSGAVIVSVPIEGTGSGPQVVFTPGAISTVVSTTGNANWQNVVVDPAGNLYLAAAYQDAVYKVAAGTQTLTPYGSGLVNPVSLALDGAGNLYVAEYANGDVKIISPTGAVSTMPGATGLAYPNAIAIDATGDLYVAQAGNSTVVKITQQGNVTTVAGVAGQQGYNGDNQQATGAYLNGPGGLGVDAAGNLYIGDTGNYRVRKVSTAGVITTIAGTGSAGYSGDQGPATSAELNDPRGQIVVDAAGDVYFEDAANNVIRKISATGTISTVAGNGTAGTSGDGGPATSAQLSFPLGLAMDSDGNLYSSDNSGTFGRIRKTTAAAVSHTFQSSYTGFASSDSPFNLTMSNIGNQALTLNVPTTGLNPSLDTGFQLENGSTCPQLDVSSDSATLAAGASCLDQIAFVPTTDGPVDGDMVVTDTNLNAAAATQTVHFSGTGLPLLANTITFTPPASPAVAGSSTTLTATASSGGPVTFTVTGGTAAISGNTITYTTAGTVTITATSPAEGYYGAATPVSYSVTVNPAPTSYTAPTEPVESASGVQTATVNFTAGGALDSISVVTQGAMGKDFSLAAGGTCSVGSDYSAGQACTVDYIFTPLSPGAREGAVVLKDAAGDVLGTSYLGGTGTGPLGLFTTATQTLNITGLSIVRGISVDGNGKIYAYETGAGIVDEFDPVTGTKTILASGYPAPWGGGTSVDGAGNVFFTDETTLSLYEFVGGNGSPEQVASIPGTDNNLEIDGAGNLYTSDVFTGAIYEISAGTYRVTTLVQGGLGHRFIGMDLDAAGDIYAADINGKALYKFTPSDFPVTASNFPSPLVQGGYLSHPDGMAVDAAGNLYVDNDGGTNIIRYAAGSYTPTVLPEQGLAGVALDTMGNLYSSPTNGSIAVYSRAQASFNFGNTKDGTTADSQQAVGFENDGNADLVITGYSAAPPFAVNGTQNTCATTTLASGAGCIVGATYTPTGAGPDSGSVILTDNTLGVDGSQQTVALSGTGLAVPTISFSVANHTYGDAPFALAATSNSTGAITYSVVSGPAQISGNTLTITGAGSVTVQASQDASGYYLSGSQTATFNVAKANATVTLGNLTQVYTGSPLTVSESTVPSGLTVDITYDGGSTAPTLAGSYAVMGTVNNANYQGTDSETFKITRAPTTLQIAVPTPGTLLGNPVSVTVTLSPFAGSDGESVSVSDGTNTYTGTLSGGRAIISIPTSAAGVYTYTATYAGDANLLGSISGSVQETVVAPSVNMGPLQVSSSTTRTITVYISHAGTLSAANVLNQGTSSASLDFVVTSSSDPSTCVVGHSYSIGDVCTVTVKFTPGYPGLRQGGVQLLDGGGNILGSEYLYGVGTGSQLVFVPPASRTIGSLWTFPANVTGDAEGNLYVWDQVNGIIWKLPRSGGSYGTAAQLYSGLTSNGQIAVDGLGSVFFTDQQNNRILELPWNGTGYSAPITAVTVNSPSGVALDSSGNLFVSDPADSEVLQFAWNGEAFASAATVSTSVGDPQGIAIDGAGNVFVADPSAGTITELSRSGSSWNATPVVSGVAGTWWVALDANDDLYFGVPAGPEKAAYANGVWATPALLTTGLPGQSGLWVDGSGNVFIATIGQQNLTELDYSTAPNLNFTTVAVGGTSPDSPKIVQVSNIGNTALNWNRLSYPTDFPENSADTNLCANGSPLLVNGVCDLSFNFIPQSVNTFQEFQTLQAISDSRHSSITLNGIGVPKPLVIVTPSTLTFGNQSQGSTSQQWRVEVKNNSNSSPLDNIVPTITQTQPAGGSNFTIVSNTCTGTVGHQVTVAPNSTCELEITFTPTNTQNSSDSYAATLSIADDGLDNQNQEPQTVPITGTGTGINVFIAPNNLVFTNVAVNSTSTQTVILDNASNGSLSIASIGINPSSGTPFAVVSGGSCQAPGTLAANSTCSIAVQYAPTTASSGSGDRAQLVVTDSGSSGNGQQTIPLTGTSQGSQLIVTPSSLDFTNTAVTATSSALSLNLKNNGSGPATVSGITVSTSGGGTIFQQAVGGTCTTAPFQLAAGQSCTVLFTFTPAQPQSYSGQVQIAADGNSQIIPMHGVGMALSVSISPGSLSFNEYVGGTTSAQQVTLNNASGATLNLGAISTANPSTFAVLTGSGYCQAGGTLAANSSCTIGVTFTAAAATTYTDTLRVQILNGAGSTQTVSLSGTGAYATATLSPSPLDFGNVEETTTSTKTVTLQNTSNYPLSITGAPVVTGTGFSLAGTTCSAAQAVPAGGSCTINITFSPVAVTSYSGSLEVFDSVSGGSQSVSLTGSGTSDVPTATLSPNSITFSSQTLGSTGNPWTMTLNNTSSIPMNNVVLSLLSTGTQTGTNFKIVNNQCSSTLAAHSTCTIQVEFSPALNAGLSQVSDTVLAGFNGPAAGSTGSVTAPLYGTPTAPTLSVSPISIDFHNVTAGVAPAEQTVTVKNTSAGSVTFTGFALSTSGSPFAVDIATSTCSLATPLAPNQQCTLNVSFTPPATVSTTTTVTNTLTVQFSPNQSAQAVQLSATEVTGVPAGQLSPSSITFTDQTQGSTGNPWTVNLSNTGGIAMLNLQIASDNPVFRILSSGCGTSLAAYSSCSIQIAFNPLTTTPLQVQAGTLTASFYGNASNVAGSSGTLQTTLQGMPIAPTVSVAPSSLAFNISSGSTSAQLVTVTNTSAGPVSFTGFTTQNNNGIFAVSPDAAQTTCSVSTPLQPSASCTIGVVFTPGTQTSTTSFPSDSLIIADTAQGSPQTVSLTGTATVAPNYAIGLNPQSLTLKAGQTGKVTFTMQPVGGFKGSVSLSCGNLPPGVSCTFAPSSLAADGSNQPVTSTLTVKTDSTTQASVGKLHGPTTALARIVLLPGLLGGLLLLWRRKKAAQWLGMLLLGVVLAGSVMGCASVSLFTPAGTSNVTVTATTTATTTTGGTDSKSVSFTLVVIQ